MAGEDDYLNAMGGAPAAISGAALTPPNQAADALGIAKSLAVPPETIVHNLDAAKSMATAQSAKAITNTNPKMAQWALGDPTHLAASQDDFPHLDGISRVLQGFAAIGQETKSFLDNMIFVQPGEPKSPLVGNPLTETKKQFQDNVQELKQNWNTKQPFIPGEVGGLSDVGSVVGPALGAAYSWLSGPLTALIGNPVERLTGVRKELTGQLAAALIPFGAKGIKGPEVPNENVNVNLGPRRIESSPNTIEGEYTVVNPHEDVAKQNADVTTALIEAAQKSKTQTRSPATMEKFIDEHVQGTDIENVNLPVSAVEDHYQGAQPQKDDGFLGNLPDVQEKLDSARVTGGNLPVPYGYYISQIDPGTLAKLTNAAALGDMPSVDEAKLEPKIENESKLESPEEPSRGAKASTDATSAIAQAKAEQYLNPIFADAKSAGMTETQFGLYSKRVQDVDEAIHSKMQKYWTDALQEERGAKFERSFGIHSEAVANEFNARPDVNARAFLTEGKLANGAESEVAPVKLDKKETLRQFGEDTVAKLPKEVFGKNGVGADDVAPYFGYDNGEEMLHEISRLEWNRLDGETIPQQNARLIKEGALARTRAEMGDAAAPDEILRAVRESVAAPEVTRLLTDEMKVLAKQAGLPFRMADVQALADNAYGKMITKDAINLRALEKLVGRNGREAEVALLKGKPQDAFVAKQRQLINNLILRQAHTFAREFAHGNAQIKNWAGSFSVKSIEQSYFDYIQTAIGYAGIPIKRSPAELVEATKGVTLESFIEDKNADGDDIVYYPIKPDTAMSALSVDDFRGTMDMLNSLAASGRNAQTIVTHNGRMELADAITRAKDQFDDTAATKTLEQLLGSSFRSKLNRGFHTLDAPVRSMEFLFDQLDNGSASGVYNDVVLRPLQNATDLENKMSRAIAEAHNEFAKKQSKEWNKSLSDQVNTALKFTDILGDNLDVVPTKLQLLGVALHYGNESSRAKLLKGYGWDGDHLERAFNYYLKDEDLNFIDHVWQTMEDLWPEIGKFTKRVSGVAPPKLVNASFSVNGRTMRGGYMPAIYDEALNAFAGKGEPGVPKDRLMSQQFYRATPPRGYSFGRTGYSAPLELNPRLISIRTTQIVHDIAWREALMGADRFLSHPEIKARVQKTLSPEYYKQFQPWLKRLAGARDSNMSEIAGWTKYVDGARQAAVNAALMFRASTVLIHGTTAAAKSVVEVGAKEMAAASAEFFTHPQDVSNFIREKSEFMTNRKHNVDRDQAEQYAKIIEKEQLAGKVIDNSQRIGFYVLGQSDWASAAPTWLGAYRKALAEGAEDSDAVFAGDKAVRKAHGSGAKVDLPNLLDPQGPVAPLIKSLTAFMTSRVNSYNRIRDVKSWRSVLGASISLVAVPAVIYTLVHQRKGEGLLAQMASNALWETLAYFPGMGVLGQKVEGNTDSSISLLDDIVKVAAQALIDTGKIIKGHGNKIQKPVEDFMKAAGYFTHGTTGAVARPVQYWWDLVSGHKHLHGQTPAAKAGDFTSSTLFGPKGK